MVYIDYDHVLRMEEGKYCRIGVQGMYQESNGQSLMRGVNGSTGPSFNTNYGGIYLEARPIKWWIPYAMGGLTSDRNQIYSPFSIGPSYLVQRIGENSRAGERTWILGTVFDFSSWVNNLSLDTVSYTHLDVYERQPRSSCASGTQHSSMPPPWRRTARSIWSAGCPCGGGHGQW